MRLNYTLIAFWMYTKEILLKNLIYLTHNPFQGIKSDVL